MTAAKHCANGESCAAYAKLGGPSKLSRYNPEPLCGECLLARRAARSAPPLSGTVYHDRDTERTRGGTCPITRGGTTGR